MAEISFDGVSKAFFGEDVLRDVSLSLRAGESFALAGPAGAGKSAAVALLMGLVKPDRGECRIRGRSCFGAAGRGRPVIGYVPQRPVIFPGLSGEEWLGWMGAYLGRISREKLHSAARRLEVRLLGEASRLPAPEKKKLHILKALMLDAEILILDDPAAGLDSLSRGALTELLLEERGAGKTIFMTARALGEALRICDQIGILREGRLTGIHAAQTLSGRRTKRYHITFENSGQAEAFAAEWEDGAQLLGDRVAVVVPGTPRALLSTLVRYSVTDLSGGEDGFQELAVLDGGGEEAL